MIDWQKTKIRCSALGMIMTDPREKAKDLSVTCESYLDELADNIEWGTQKDIVARAITKGLMVEEDSITLHSLYRQKKGIIKFMRKNEERISNDFISGTPDLWEGESIQNATLVIDVKSSWDSITFRKSSRSITKNYFYQLQGYMALTGAKESILAYCLIDTPEALIQDEIKKAQWKIGAIDDSTPEFQELEAKIRKNMTFSNRPLEKRVHEFVIKRDDEVIKNIYTRVSMCRNWLTRNYGT